MATAIGTGSLVGYSDQDIKLNPSDILNLTNMCNLNSKIIMLTDAFLSSLSVCYSRTSP